MQDYRRDVPGDPAVDQFASPETWLLSNGLVSEHSEQNLLLYGHISVPGVAAVELLLDAPKRHIHYIIVLGLRSYSMYKLQKWLETRNGLLSKLALLCFLRVFGSYNPGSRIARCVRDYAGKHWKTRAEVLSVKQYNKITADDRAKGWVLQAGIEPDRPVRQDEGAPAASTGPV